MTLVHLPTCPRCGASNTTDAGSIVVGDDHIIAPCDRCHGRWPIPQHDDVLGILIACGAQIDVDELIATLGRS